MTFID
jgi:rRNA biogenesis protein RRP5